MSDRKKAPPLFYIILVSVMVLAIIPVAALNVYITERLSEYEFAQPKYAAEQVFNKYFGYPDFTSLIQDSGYVLREGETLENAVEYFTKLTTENTLVFSQVTSAFEVRSDALAYIVRAGDVNVAKITLVPSGEVTKHGHTLYEDGGIMLIRRDRPEPPAPQPLTAPEPEPEPESEPVIYSDELKSLYEQYVINAVESYSLCSRNKITREKVVIYYEPGSDIYKRINSIGIGYLQPYDSYSFENVIADEFLELEDDAFSCRVRYTFRMVSTGQEDMVEIVDYTLFLRPNKNGTYLIYDQFVTGSAPAQPEPEPEPEPVTPTELIYHAFLDGSDAAALTDGDYSTKEILNPGQTITVDSDHPSKYVYIIWDKPPVTPTLKANGKTLPLGRYGFLHELVTLDTASDSIELIADGQSTVCDVFLFAADNLPDWVQQWQPPLVKADLLVLPTHSGDEHLFFGGILPTYAGELGMSVQLAYMTNHWGQSLRHHELLDGLWTVGVANYPVIGPFADNINSKESLSAAEQVYGRETVLAYQVEILRRFKPVVVVGPDLNGEYGHGANMLNALTLTQAVELSNDPKCYPQSAAAYGVWDVPKTYLHLYGENQLIMDWNQPLVRFGGMTGFEMAQSGFASHKTQSGGFTVRQNGTWQDCRKFGLYRSTVGPDTAKNDLFENIVVVQKTERLGSIR